MGAAESVCAGKNIEGDEVLAVLFQLVDKSLVTAQERGGETRYRLLEMVRQYGREKLDDSGEEAEVRRRHAGYFVELAEEAERELNGPDQARWLTRLARNGTASQPGTPSRARAEFLPISP